MLRRSTIPTTRAWLTRSSRPAEMVFLPLGVRLTPVAYARSSGKATTFGPGQGITFNDIDRDMADKLLRIFWDA